MKRMLVPLVVGLFWLTSARVSPAVEEDVQANGDVPTQDAALITGPVTFPRVQYEARVSEGEARIVARVLVEASKAGTQGLFEGELALLPSKLPAHLQIERAGNRFGLVVDKRGRYEFTVEMMAKVQDLEPWNEISFTGPPAAMGSLMASANGANVELQLLSGTTTATERANGGIRVKGVLGVERKVSIRWSGNGFAEGTARKPVVTTETAVTAEITPAVIKYATRFKCDVLQGSVSKLQLSLPASHTLTRLAGGDIRDWEIKAPSGNPTNSAGQLLDVQFLKPQGGSFELSIYSEQTVQATPFTVQLSAPQPLGVEREAGLFTITAEDISAEVSAAEELRQVNAPAGALACYRFNTRPFALSLNLRRVEPLVTVDERLASTLEEARLVTHYSLGLQVEKAAVYGLDLLMPAGFVVGAVQGDDILDWKLSDTDRKLRVNFTKRVSGARRIDVVLEQALKDFPEKIVLEPLRVAGASKETAEISARAVPGIRIKTAELAGVREVPTRTLQPEAKEAAPEDSLGFKSEQPDWKVTLAADRLSPRIVSEIFNLVTIGDGILGGSATIRYGLLNQGVQEFEITAPASWKNLEFTGPNIRRKEQKPDGTWVVGLQDKVWGGYTLVVTYDFQFDPKGATLSIGGIHTKGVERETGSAVITTASGLKLVPRTVSEALRRIDELELSAANRALITRSVSLAYQYEASPYQLEVQAQPFEEVSVLSAVADRTQVTSVLTAAGEMLTQASFMVKNNDKQFQRFKLPKGATFWSCHVNGEPAKAERDGDWVLAPLPRGANRNQAFAVDIVYAETKGVRPTVWPQGLALSAPQTDVPNTYAEWQLYFPSAYRLSGLSGNMVPVRGTTYDLQDAWQKFIRFYWEFLHESGPGLLLALSLGGLVIALVGAARRHGGSGVMSVLVVFAIMVILAGMLLPALSRAKARAQRINGLNNLKQIGLAARTFALDNTNRLPNSFEEMMNELSTDKITYDPETGQRYTYVGAGYDIEKILPDSVIAYSPPNTRNYRDVALADGSVQQMSARQFEELERRGLIRMATPQQVAQNQQAAAVRGAQALAAPDPSIDSAAPRPAQPGAVIPRMRSIRIDIPREGQTFTFTKVLHLDSKPLLVEAQMMSLKAFQMVQMCLQSGTFVAGLVVMWRQWRSRRNSLVLAVGLALCIGAVGDLLLSWRLLHLALIWLTPLLCLGLIGWVTWKLWPRSANAPAGQHLSPGLPPAVASLAVLGLTLFSAEAAPEDVRPGGSPAIIVDSVSIRSARYTVKVVDQVATVEVALAATTREANQKLFLFGDDVAVQRFECKPAQAKLVREARGVAMVVPHPGNATAQLTLVLKLGGDVTKRQLDFAVPSSLSSEWSISLDQPDADVEFPAATWVKHSTSGQETQVEAIMGSGERAQLFWTPKVKRAAETTANVISHTTTLLTFGNGVLNERATIDYQVTQGELRQLRIGLPSGERLLRVEGEGIRTWDNSGGHEQTIELELLKGVSSNYRLTVETEKPLGSLPATVTAETARPLGVSRETGLLGIRSDDDLELVVQRSSELYRVETEAFDRQAGPKVERIMNAFRFLRPDFKLEVRVAAMQPEIQASTHNRFRVGQEQVGLSTTLDYLIKRAGVFRLKASLPDGYRVDSVIGTNILQTTERQEPNGQRVLEVTLKEKKMGAYSMRLELTQIFKELPGTLSLAGVQPLEVQKLDGFVLVSAEPGVAVKPASFEGLIEIPATAAGAVDNSSIGGSLAYKLIAGTPHAQAAWKLVLQTEKVGSWVRAEFVTTLALSETMITGRALGRFDVQNAPIKELRLKIPSAYKNVEITGPNIRRRDHNGDIWTVEFQGKIRGVHTLTITWEQPRTVKGDHLDLTGPGAEGVERETGVIVVVARPPLQVGENDAAGLKRTDLRDLPDWAGEPDEGAVLAYRYLRPGYKLGVTATRFGEAELLQALVENLTLNTVIADDGQMMTEATMLVHNRDRQHLEITLPAGAKVWSAFIAGQAVRPSLSGGRLLLPLEHSIGDDSAIPIALTYVQSGTFPRNRGQLELVSPRLDAPLKSARWEVFLPPDYNYSRFGGSMAHEAEAVVEDASNFSSLDYSSRESSSKAQLAKELTSELSSAKQKLSSGNVKAALADYNRARNKGDVAVANNSQARQLEAELRRAQGNNLIHAQTAFSQRYGIATMQVPGQAGNPQTLRYDNEAAEAQWTRLQQAQDLVMTTVQPIHVNLPTRGLRYSFTQTLQTEAARPLTVRFFASNSRTHGWLPRVAQPLVGFLVLWAGVLLVVRKIPVARRQQPTTLSV